MIANAGIIVPKRFLELSLHEWEKVQSVCYIYIDFTIWYFPTVKYPNVLTISLSLGQRDRSLSLL